MTDEEILKRLAEIEGPPIFRWSDAILLKYPFMSPYDDGHGEEWDPLKNWEDLGPLIEKYKLNIAYNQGGPWTDPEAEDGTWEVAPDDGSFRVYGRDKSLPRAICLAIIEAHK